MASWPRRAVATVAAIAAAGVPAACGSSSSQHASSQARSPQAAALASILLKPSTPVGSTVFRAYLLRSLRASGLSLKDAQKSASCGIPKLLSLGIHTYGEFLDPHNAAIGRK